MKNEMLQVLAQFHREVFLPDFQRIVDEAIEKSVGSMRSEKSEYYGLRSWISHLDDRLSRVECDVQSSNADMGRVESELRFVKSHLVALEMRVTDIENKIDRLATETELVEIRQQIVILNDRIAALETRH
jgi:chromosome segregation ATPase